MNEKSYRINEIFYSIQGEGIRAGTANLFVRFTGCNLRCAIEPGDKSPGGFDCDTEFESGRTMSADDIITMCKDLAGFHDGSCRNVIFTGGEPALQLDPALIDQFRREGFRHFAIETNGSKELSRELGLNWITVSPKVAEHAIRQLTADEVKYVRGYGQGIPRTVVQAPYKLISPAFDGDRIDERTLNWCKQLVLDNPDWQLSVQQHKAWKAR